MVTLFHKQINLINQFMYFRNKKQKDGLYQNVPFIGKYTSYHIIIIYIL
jgi:hypothetical protein